MNWLRGQARTLRTGIACLAIVSGATALAARAGAQPMRGPRGGMRADGGMHGPHGTGGHGAWCDESDAPTNHHADMALIHELFADPSLRRSVKEIPGGVETVTESGSPEGAERIRRHVRSMHERLLQDLPIHVCDELFSEIFAYAKDIDMQIFDTPAGVRVRETSKQPYVTALIRAHALVVTKFIENGMREMHVNHPAPAR